MESMKPMKIREIIEKEPDIIRVERELDMPLTELWDWITKSQLTEQWFGPWKWTGEDEIEVTLFREEGSPVSKAKIMEINPLKGYTLLMEEDGPAWQLLVSIDESDDGKSRLILIQPWEGQEYRREMTAGWEYYADCLVAAIKKTPDPEFEDYL